jgi:RIO-like serine/threonine protein kinase
MTLLKRDLFGTISCENFGSRASNGPTGLIVIRDTRTARNGLKWFARHLARREVRALQRLEGVTGVPKLLAYDRHLVTRQWITGEPMQRAKPANAEYFRQGLHLLRQLHACRVAHNDLAKEPNWIVTADGRPALVDFQLAHCARRRGRFFRLLAHDDLRHLLKHKRSYIPDRLTARERAILARPSIVARAWMSTAKPVYLFVTRRILRWSDREGAGDRLHDPPQTR